jgi:hypothetical protein
MGIHKRRVPETTWIEFCKAFSRQHRGESTEISDVTPGSAPRLIASEAPLLGIEIKTRSDPESAAPENALQRDFCVALEPSTDRQSTILEIPRPEELKTLVQADGTRAGLEVDTAAGHVIELWLSSRERLQSIDGIV